MAPDTNIPRVEPLGKWPKRKEAKFPKKYWAKDSQPFQTSFRAALREDPDNKLVER